MEKRQHSEYYDALERLDKNKPIRLPKGTKVKKSNVELEAGRTKGAIKSGRKGFQILIDAIHEVEARQSAPKKKAKRLKSTKSLVKAIRKNIWRHWDENLCLLKD